MENKNFPVSGMMCASCALSIENILKKTNWVRSVVVNFASQKAHVEYDEKIISKEELKKIVQDVGYDMEVDFMTRSELAEKKQKDLQKQKWHFIGSLFCSIPIFLLSMVFTNFPGNEYIQLILATIGVIFFGKWFFIGAYKSLKNKAANMDTLVAMSISVAYIYSVCQIFFGAFFRDLGITPHLYFEASVMIISFILFGKYLEDLAKNRTSESIEKLMDLQPSTAFVKKLNDWQEIPAEEIRKWDIILVKSGQKIAVDGKIISGKSLVDESMITGESVPVEKKIDSSVFSGTLNQTGSFEMIAEKVGTETFLSSIIAAVENASGSKAPIQKLVDKISAIFVPTVITIAIVTFILWILFDKNNGFAHGLQSFVSILVIACPCALGLATPTAIMVGMGKWAEKWILIKDAEALEKSANISAVLLDKTGTITEWKPTVVADFWKNKNRDISIVTSLEKKSHHPLSQAIISHFESTKNLEITNFTEILGKWIRGDFDGKTYHIWSLEFIVSEGVKNNFTEEIKQIPENAATLAFADSDEILAFFALQDTVKNSSKQAIKNLQKNGVEVYMLTGDAENVAKQIADEVEIRHYTAKMKPQDKQDFVKNLQKNGKIVAMVGDGINDSQALAESDVSIAMGKWSDIAMDTASATIISSDLMKISELIHLSKNTKNTIRSNLFWAFIYNLIGIPLAAGILYPFFGILISPMVASFAMAMSSVSVVANSLLLKFKK